MLFSCEGLPTGTGNEGENGGNNGGTGGSGEKKVLKINSDKNLIQTFGGDYATLTVTLGGEVVTEGVTFYDEKYNVLPIEDFKFSATEPGEYTFLASYGTFLSETISIKAISIEIPETPADPKPESTDFKVRTLFTEFTTTGCSWCPSMKAVIHEAMAKPEVAERVVLATCHSSLVNSKKDPAYIRTGYEEFSGMTGMPYMFCDMYYGFGYYNSLSASDIEGVVDELCSSKEDVAAGIAVNASLKDGQLVAKVTVKAAETGNYRIGAFLLEDGIYGQQTSATEDWMHMHDGVMRYIDSKYYTATGREQYYGHSVGEVAEGKTADYVFVWMLDEIWEAGALAGEQYGGYYWDEFVLENLHLAVFVSTIGTNKDGDEFYYVNNVIDCPVNGKTQYEYAE